MRRINPGTLVGALGAILLLTSLFLHWYQPGLSAWTTFEVWDLVLAALALATLVGSAADLGWWRGPLPGVRNLTIAIAALVIVVGALVNHPPAAVGRDAEAGAWLALAATALMAAGAFLGEARISLSLSVDRSGSGAARAAVPDGGPPPAPTEHDRTVAQQPTDPGTVPVPGTRLADAHDGDTRLMPDPDLPRRSQR